MGSIKYYNSITGTDKGIQYFLIFALGTRVPAIHALACYCNEVTKCLTKTTLSVRLIEPRHEKTGFLHMRKQRRRSAAA